MPGRMIGATGGASSLPTISNFSFTTLPEPASIGLLACGAPSLMRGVGATNLQARLLCAIEAAQRGF